MDVAELAQGKTQSGDEAFGTTMCLSTNSRSKACCKWLLGL